METILEGIVFLPHSFSNLPLTSCRSFSDFPECHLSLCNVYVQPPAVLEVYVKRTLKYSSKCIPIFCSSGDDKRFLAVHSGTLEFGHFILISWFLCSAWNPIISRNFPLFTAATKKCLFIDLSMIHTYIIWSLLMNNIQTALCSYVAQHHVTRRMWFSTSWNL